ncbi:uncharacterized protein LOC142331515 [Lycorma delicatula]|uniref:uncharacterized protein LOC142331515 n=1 Tax=Lycorma delicatula TaxID=130591 RepID=UPI003F50FE8C
MDDDDDEEGQPAKYEFSVESKLDEDHVFFLQFTNNFISNVTRPRDFDHCTRWLERLAGEPMYGVSAKRNRNMFLAKLLVAMMDNQVKGPFLSFPPTGPLPNAGEVFGLISEEERAESADMALDWPDKEINMQDYKFKSTDGRTYVASKRLPESSGMMGYVGITYGGGEGLWLNRAGEKVSLTDVLCGDRVPTIDTTTPIKTQIEMVEAYDPKLEEEEENEESWPFTFVEKLPESRSDSNLVEIKQSGFNPSNCQLMREIYPDGLIERLAELLSKSKKQTDIRLRARHTKVLEQIYKGYQEEVERGLSDYKLARVEWQRVMAVIQDLKKIQKEVAKRDIELAGSSDDTLKILSESYNNAVARKKLVYEEGELLDKQKHEMHQIIHDRAMAQRSELQLLEAHIEKLGSEITRLRLETRRKQQIIDGLMMDRRDSW